MKHTQAGPLYVRHGQDIMRDDAGIGPVKVAEVHAGHREEREALARLFAAAPELAAACHAPDVDKAHDWLSAILENPDNAGKYDLIRRASVETCLALNAHHEKRRMALKKAGIK